MTCLWYNKPCGAPATQSDYIQYPGWSSVPFYWEQNTQSFKCWWN